MHANHRKPLIAGNWKMYKTVAEAVAFVDALDAQLKAVPKDSLPDVMICPSFVALETVRKHIQTLKSPVLLASQTMESQKEGAYTGEVSPHMLKDLGVDAVVIGHSERRQYYNETNETVNAKLKAALEYGLLPIVCVGETLAQREAGQTDDVIRQQVNAALKDIPADALNRLVFAYEPVWAIGTGKVCESPEANRVCGLVRSVASQLGDVKALRVLYGGSVKPDNIDELVRQPDVDGALVGGASLDPKSFFTLVSSASLVNAS